MKLCENANEGKIKAVWQWRKIQPLYKRVLMLGFNGKALHEIVRTRGQNQSSLACLCNLNRIKLSAGTAMNFFPGLNKSETAVLLQVIA